MSAIWHSDLPDSLVTFKCLGSLTNFCTELLNPEQFQEHFMSNEKHLQSVIKSSHENSKSTKFYVNTLTVGCFKEPNAIYAPRCFVYSLMTQHNKTKWDYFTKLCFIKAYSFSQQISKHSASSMMATYCTINMWLSLQTLNQTIQQLILALHLT